MIKGLTIRTPYINPPHSVPEDFSLVPSCTDTAEESGYEDINVLIHKLMRGEPINSVVHSLDDSDVDLQDIPIEDLKQSLDEARAEALGLSSGSSSVSDDNGGESNNKPDITPTGTPEGTENK